MRGYFRKLGAVGLLASVALIFSVSGCEAQKPTSQAPAGQMPDRFSVMDVNKDGRVVIEEFRAAFPNMNENAFGVIDLNGDGAIEQAEWAQFMEGHSKGMSMPPEKGAPMNNIPGDPLIPPVDSSDLPLMRPPAE